MLPTSLVVPSIWAVVPDKYQSTLWSGLWIYKGFWLGMEGNLLMSGMTHFMAP